MPKLCTTQNSARLNPQSSSISLLNNPLLPLPTRRWQPSPSPPKRAAPPKKPIDWSQHMIVASLKFYSSIDPRASIYETLDAGRLAVFDALNWHEAHDEYAWPDFANLGFDFAQVISFRRHLVSDVFGALEKAGVVRVGGEAGGEGMVKMVTSRRGSVAGMRMSERKRQCRREDSADVEA